MKSRAFGEKVIAAITAYQTAGNMMVEALQKNAIAFDHLSHTARQSNNFIQAQTLSDMATEARRAIQAWDRKGEWK